MHPLVAAFNSHWEPLFWFALGVCGAIGIVATLHPRRMVALTMREAESVGSLKGASSDDQSAGGGSLALALCRLFGVVELAAIAALGYWLASR